MNRSRGVYANVTVTYQKIWVDSIRLYGYLTRYKSKGLPPNLLTNVRGYGAWAARFLRGLVVSCTRLPSGYTSVDTNLT